jgi:hypothetical protein
VVAAEIRKLRIRQLMFLNGLLLFLLTLAYIITSLIAITYTQMFLLLGITVLAQSIIGFLKGNSTKSICPVVEQVAIYEKEKMGSEWRKQRKVSSIWSLFMSVMMFLNAYVQQNSGEFVNFDLSFIFLLAIGILMVMNLSFILHSRKVDGARTKSDLKGFTLKSNLIGIVIGGLFGIILFIFTIAYAVSGF